MYKLPVSFLTLPLLLACGPAEPQPTVSVAQEAVATSTPTVLHAEAAPDRPAEDAGVQAPVAATAPGGELLFFLNPKGRPCQMQQAIIAQLGDDLPVTVREVSVLDDANRPSLYQYGVRSLPALILVDAAGKEVHRFTPGIQPADTILAALD